MIGTITLNPSLDHNWIVEGFVKDDTNRVKELIETPGGKGVNVSKVVRELGGRTHAFALLGGLAGARHKRLTRSLDFPLTEVPIAGETRINIVLTDIKDRTQSRISAKGPSVTPSEMRRLVRRLCAVRPRPAYWVFGGSLPGDLAPDTYRQLIGTLQANGTPCVLDADGRALAEGVKARPFMIKPNEFEMQRLCGRRLSSVDSYVREARKLAASGIGLVVVSLAKRGALFVSGYQAFRVTTPDVPVRSHIGAGDSLIGGLLHGLQRGLPLQRAAMTGVAASTSSVMRSAPRLCHRSDITALLRRLRVIKI